jgi:hypothetical protein
LTKLLIKERGFNAGWVAFRQSLVSVLHLPHQSADLATF